MTTVLTTTTRAEDESFVFACPHCQGTVQVSPHDLHCRIFRHGVFKNVPNMPPIPPHASREECERWFQRGEILGCGKPFQLVPHPEVAPNFIVQICGFI